MIANALAIGGGMMVAESSFGVRPTLFWQYSFTTIEGYDLLMGLVKPITFGVVVGLAGSFSGMHTKRDARGVGRATTQAVVTSIIGVIVLDYVITKLIFFFAS